MTTRNQTQITTVIQQLKEDRTREFVERNALPLVLEFKETKAVPNSYSKGGRVTIANKIQLPKCRTINSKDRRTTVTHTQCDRVHL